MEADAIGDMIAQETAAGHPTGYSLPMMGGDAMAPLANEKKVVISEGVYEHWNDPNHYLAAGLDMGGQDSSVAVLLVEDRAYTALAEPLKAAEYAARAAMAAVHRDAPALQLLPDDDLAKYVCGLKAAADFIRGGGAQAEGRVFWNHLALGGFHPYGVNSWDNLPFALRLGWATFGSVLVTYDAFAAADAAKGLQPAPAPMHRVPIEDTTLETIDGPLDRFDDKR